MLFVAGFLALFLLLWLLFVPAGPLIGRALGHLGHRTAAFRYRDYLPVVILLLAGAIVTAAAGDQFLDLAEHVQSGSETLQRIDAEVHEWARGRHSAAATLFFTFFTYVGTPVGLGLIVAAVVTGLAMQGRYRWCAYLAGTAIIGALLVIELKLLFARARPDLAAALRSAHGYSFPSGHAMGSTIVFGALSYLIVRAHAPWWKRAAGLAAAATAILAVSLSRVYLGVHWISDIGAGIAAGVLWATVATVAYEAFRRIRMVRAFRRMKDEG
ncbi:MAG TPA: phosphatase PAP2 family protein [Thermoanaerobaculia bacterium]|nr:phosphatase PAP2 family protein [Thermoanaerobaculia bacterium]